MIHGILLMGIVRFPHNGHHEQNLVVIHLLNLVNLSVGYFVIYSLNSCFFMTFNFDNNIWPHPTLTPTYMTFTKISLYLVPTRGTIQITFWSVGNVHVLWCIEISKGPMMFANEVATSLVASCGFLNLKLSWHQQWRPSKTYFSYMLKSAIATPWMVKHVVAPML